MPREVDLLLRESRDHGAREGRIASENLAANKRSDRLGARNEVCVLQNPLDKRGNLLSAVLQFFHFLFFLIRLINRLVLRPVFYLADCVCVIN